MFDVKDKTVLVAGGSGYLGAPVCEAFLAQGAKLIVVDREKPMGISKADFLKADISDESELETLFTTIDRKYRRLDVVINMTFSSSGMTFDQMKMADWERGLRVNVTAAFFLSRASGNMMKKTGGGSIVHFGSMYGMVSPCPEIYETEEAINPIEYGVGKAGILQMVRYQAVKWAKDGVRVNAIVPGAFPNKETQKNVSFVEALNEKVPMGRIGKPREIVGAAIFLASDEASYITGQSIVVDGGWTIW